MATNQTIDFKDPLWITAWLDTALEKEKEKYEKCPVKSDLLPGHEAAQAWGYVVAGYFLVEESFKPGFPFWPWHGRSIHPRCPEDHVFSC